MSHHLLPADMGARARRREWWRWVALAVVAALLTTTTWMFAGQRNRTMITAYFASTVGIYPDSEVKMLGIPIGSVESVRPEGTRVRVTLSVPADLTLPANVKAAVIAPTLVADRYLQLAPPYSKGPKLGGDVVIPMSRTATPVEVDELMASLNQLITALGPEGANADGSVSELLEQGARILDGNGAAAGKTIKRLGKLARTLSGSGEELFNTVENISEFTAMLAEYDGVVRAATKHMSSITKVLADQRGELSGALRQLTIAMELIQDFVANNRAAVKANVEGLLDVAKVIAKRKDSLGEALNTAPLALQNLLNAYRPGAGVIDGRANLLEYLPLGGGAWG